MQGKFYILSFSLRSNIMIMFSNETLALMCSMGFAVAFFIIADYAISTLPKTVKQKTRNLFVYAMLFICLMCMAAIYLIVITTVHVAA